MFNNLSSALKLTLLLCASLLVSPVFATIDVYQFNSEQDRIRFQTLTTELRCPKCQNQNLADSNAPIAQDLRTKIHSMLTEQRSDQEIIDYMIARYGDFVLYQPRMDTKTYILWFGPAALLILGVGVVFWISRKNTAQATTTAIESDSLDAQQQQQLADLLNDKGNSAP